MKVIADLHIHSRYAMACSKQISIDNLEKWGKIKGVDVLGTGDFCHPEWIKELKSKLKPDGKGIFRTESGFPFILQNEISLIYTQGRGRRIHLVVLAPSFEVVDKITKYLLTKGRVDYDGRPIFKISCEDFVREMRKISKDIEIIPAHVWTPYFGLFGSKTGFNSVEEAFGDQAKHIHALETGISSDPEMNNRIERLDGYNLVSFSDMHSFWPWRIAREATIFEIKELTYDNIVNSIRTGEGLVGTIEVDPNYGKYHHDGHSKCNINFDPEQSKKHNRICPVCKKPLTIGVAYRVEELADHAPGRKNSRSKPFKRIIPLHELIVLITNSGINTKKVWNIYNKVITAGKSEFDILLNVSEEKLLKVADPKLVKLIIRNREEKIKIIAGYDGEYGVPLIGGLPDEGQIDNEKKSASSHPQKGLNDFI